MKAVLQDKPGGKLSIDEIDIPKPDDGEVLIKMAWAPINPSDLSLLQGTYADKPDYPIIPGIEGSGLVIASGKGIIARSRLGKRVSCSSTKGKGGTWAEYMVTSAFKCVPLGKNISEEQGSMLLINPLTALGFIEIARKGKHKTIVNNAAASSLGKMLLKLCHKYNINIINIVYKEEHIDILTRLGAKHVLLSQKADFEQKLKALSNELNAKLFFDAVGGSQTSIMVNSAPPGSRIIVYAKLSEDDFSLDSRMLIQNNKTIEGFFLGSWSHKHSIIQNLKSINKVKSLITEELYSPVQARYPISKINEAVQTYRENMTSGKVLLHP